MRLACDSCGELGPLQIQLPAAAKGDGLVGKIECARCGAVGEVPLTQGAPLLVEPEPETEPIAAQATAGAVAAAIADRRCPKCHARVGSRPACPSCGLASARMASFAADRDADIPPSLHAAWKRVTEAWGEQPRHDAFVQAVAYAGAFAWAAGQYQDARRRGVGRAADLGDGQGDAESAATQGVATEVIAAAHDAIAARQLERVRRTAEAAMLAGAAARRDDTKPPYRSATTILVMMVVVLIAGALYARFMREARAPAGPVTPVLPVSRGAAR